MIYLLKDTFIYVINTLINDSIPLGFGIVVACILNVYIDAEKFKNFLLRKRKASVVGSVAFGAFTPLCACGTMAVIVSMLTTVLPWGPIMAFITSSPIMSPDLFIMLSGMISMKFALALLGSSIFIGCFAGYLSNYLEKNTNFFENQTRISYKQSDFAEIQECCCNCEGIGEGTVPLSIEKNKENICCETKVISQKLSIIKKYKIDELFYIFINLGLKKIIVYFSVFAAIGYLINRFVPADIIVSLFGAGNIFSVPLAALIGVPLYVSDASSIPLLKTFLDAGASSGAILAFMITGPGTSIGAIAGSLTIMRKKVVLFYVSILFMCAIILGYLYDFLILIGL